MEYRLDNGAVVTWRDDKLTGTFTQLSRMEAYCGYDPQPAMLYFARYEDALTVALDWALSVPWTRHASILTYTPSDTARYGADSVHITVHRDLHAGSDDGVYPVVIESFDDYRNRREDMRRAV